MEDYSYFRRSHVPAFGSWDWNGDVPFTQCFESARQAALIRYSCSQDQDLYVAGDLYQNDVVTPAMIVVPRHTMKALEANEKEEKKESWAKSPIAISRPTPKPVDEDLYKISPDLLYAKPKKKRGMGLFSSCLGPGCAF